jgi:UPF0755 protein
MLRRLVALVIVVAAVVGGGAFAVWRGMHEPYRGFADDEVFVELPQGARTAEIAGALAAAGVVPDALTFRLAVRMANADRHLKAGEYRFFEAATPDQIIARLMRGDTYTRALTFPEGLNIHDMAAIFEKAGMGTADDFVQAANTVSLIADVDPDAGNLEGYLFPSTYSLPRRIGADGVIRAMVKEFRKALGSEPLPEGMTVRDLVTLASIVEKETGQSSERAQVAGVYTNRLRIHMPLQCDPTVIYALMLRGTWDGNIRKGDLSIDSPYNTYKYPGLPPGPIASPGRASLDAARHPAISKYLYFVSRNDGTHVYAETLAEHNKNVREFQQKKR